MSVEGLQLPGEGLDHKLPSISALSVVAATHQPPTATWQATVYMFLEQIAHSMWEQGWVKKTLSSKYWRSVF